MLNGLDIGDGGTLEIQGLLINLSIGAALAYVIVFHFIKFGSALANREDLARVFPLLLLTTVLIISIVKSSLALSLGLVGALSIVRFRTPIKEPEELTYLFITIGAGLGLGASQTKATVVATLAILGFVSLFRWKDRKKQNKNLFLSVDWINLTENSSKQSLNLLNTALGKHTTACDLRRFDTREDHVEATYLLELSESVKLEDLIDELNRELPSAGITFLDQNKLPAI